MATALRGEIRWHNYGPVTGAELSGDRPGLIISNDACNREFTTAISVPTSKTPPPEHLERNHIRLEESDSYASAGQMKTILQEDLRDLIGKASDEELSDVIKSIAGGLTRPTRRNRRQRGRDLPWIERGAVVKSDAETEEGTEDNELLVVGYNEYNGLVTVTELERQPSNEKSWTRIPVRIEGDSGRAQARVHRVQTVDAVERGLVQTGRADLRDTQNVISMLIWMIQEEENAETPELG